ncbi:ATP-binding protein [Streptomyces gilvosporeus]|uniref:ATP-binding protein n=1 Tax=Streptomyces gilvosporeus TaxID=553510 RepID=UPI001F34BE85|nr:ATP-binding protein [Streptomyces gilvosporeus]
MTSIPEALLWCLSAGTAAAVVLAAIVARARMHSAALKQRLSTAEEQNSASLHANTELTARLRATEAEIRHLAGARLPDLTLALAHPHVPVRGLLDTRFAGSETDQALSAVLEQIAEAVTKERERVDAAAQSTLRGATTTIQALLYQLQTQLQGMQHRYDDPNVAQDLLSADFLNEQALRRIQATGVVCGAWPGLTREDSYLAELVVGATSRLRGYERVQITNQLRDPIAVVARAVEPVAITVTELLANALHHSHQELPVSVTLQQGNRGASVIIDDYGVGMHEEELAHAAKLLSGDEQLLLTQLGDPPRSGFAAAGQLVRQYGYRVHIESSPYGGVRAIVYIPGDPLLTVLDESHQPMSVMAPTPHRSPAVDRGTLPTRNPGHAAAQPPAPAPSPVTAPAPDPAELLGGGTYGAAAHDAGSAPAAGGSELGGGPDLGAGFDAVRTGFDAVDAAFDSARTGFDSAGAGFDSAAGSASGAAGSASGFGDGPGADAAAGGGEPELPRRRRRQPMSELDQNTPRTAPQRTPEETASRWAALQQGTESGRAAAQQSQPPRSTEGNPQ